MNSKASRIHSKVVDLTDLARACNGWRVKGEKIVFTNGCFDVLHRGHIELLLQAAEEGHRLVIGLNTDASVSRLKGAGRPINQEADRALLLAAQAFVDAVCLFDADTPINLIAALQPDVLVKGGDYTEATVIGADSVKHHGGRVVIIPLSQGYSSTGTIEKMK